jgi:hypothetical protein
MQMTSKLYNKVTAVCRQEVSSGMLIEYEL